MKKVKKLLILILLGLVSITACKKTKTAPAASTAPTITGFTVTLPATTTAGTTFYLTAPASSSKGAFTYVSGNAAILTIVGNKVTIVGPGTTTITATQAADGGFTEGSVKAQVTITTPVPQPKTTAVISIFSILACEYLDKTITIKDPVSNSNAPFTYESSNTAIATITGNTVTIKGAGVVVITAKQVANANFTAALSNTFLVIHKSAPTLSGFKIAGHNLGEGSFALTDPLSKSDGGFTYTTNSPNITISNKKVSMADLGVAYITVSQAETANFKSADATAFFTIKITKGTYYHGGYVFEVDASGQHGLITAVSDLANTYVWADGNHESQPTGATDAEDGLGNTSKIVTIYGSGVYAAKACVDLKVVFGLDTYTNWFLPSKNQLVRLAKAIQLTNYYLKYSNEYWSSTEASNQAGFNCYEWAQSGNYKSKSSYVRPISQF